MNFLVLNPEMGYTILEEAQIPRTMGGIVLEK
jgi:hypothetical protein